MKQNPAERTNDFNELIAAQDRDRWTIVINGKDHQESQLLLVHWYKFFIINISIYCKPQFIPY